MRRVWVALLLLILAAPAARGAAPMAFHDPVLGYSFSYDPSCKLTVNQHQSPRDRSEWFLECAHADSGRVWNLSLTVNLATTYPDGRLIAQELTASLKRDVPGLQVLKDPVQSAVMPAAWAFEWVAPQKTQRMHGEQYVTLQNVQQKVYVFTAGAPDRMFARCKPEWERVLASFKFD